MLAILDRIKDQSPLALSALSLLFAALLGVADYVTGDFSLLIFYLIPIAFATWFAGRTAGLLISFFCATELFVTAVILRPPGSPLVSMRSWNVLVEAVFLLLTAHVLYLLKIELEKNEQRALALEAANLELDAFNYSVTHDLRKPLSAINGFSQLVLDEYGQELNENCRDYVREIYEGTVRMDKLIVALLDFSRLGHCELRFEPVDLGRIARDVVVNLQLADPQRRVTVRVADGLTANGDQELLQSVLENLLGNAWKYTGKVEGASIEVGETVARGKRTFYVRDNGTGFDMSEADKLFLPFQRLHGADDFKGHGIGLSTVRRIIERHGGSIWATAEVGRGATFYFTI